MTLIHKEYSIFMQKPRGIHDYILARLDQGWKLETRNYKGSTFNLVNPRVKSNYRIVYKRTLDYMIEQGWLRINAFGEYYITREYKDYESNNSRF